MAHKTISLKLKLETFNNIERAVEKYNKDNLFNLNKSEFMRMAMELLSQLVLQGKEIPIKIR